MFGIRENGCVGFESSWKVTRIQSATSTQTDGFSVAHSSTNTATFKEMEVQTDSIEVNTTPVFDEAKLSNWLKEMYPKVKDEIDSTNSFAFKEYDKVCGNLDTNCKLQQTLTVFDANNESGEHNLQISSMSWNCSGQTLAISSTQEHKNWCHHRGVVILFNLKSDGLLSDKPLKKLFADTCVHVVNFHPNIPYILAAGTHTGEIVLWNVHSAENDGLICKATAHSESATQISWVYDPKYLQSVVLVSASLDGFLNFWSFNITKLSLTLKHRYKIKSPIFPKDERISSGKFSEKVARGIICFDFSPFTPDLFVVAAEGGLVVQCSLTGTNRLKGSSSTVPISDPVQKYYEPHTGDITSISFSPNRKEMFMTTATDDEIRIYLIDQEEAAQIIYAKGAVNCCLWIPHEEKLIVSCGSKGCLELFNITDGKLRQTIDNDRTCSLLCMKINKKRTSLVATGTNAGNIQLWNCPWHLFR